MYAVVWLVVVGLVFLAVRHVLSYGDNGKGPRSTGLPGQL